jgi:light-regulated signal transduction histidine kinase (bacteriophytochrome)/EAL domain-containing protein (putative c-di-GMP-specific phosphodiesterase class I)
MPEMSGQETISTELEQACAEEPIHIIGTVQPHGFVLVVDIATTRIVQVSSGAARHWKGLAQSADLLQIEIADRIDGFGADPASVLGALPRADPIVLPLRPRLVAPGVAARSLVALASKFECVGHRVGDLAILEWQPLGNAADALTSSAQGMVAITSSLLRLRTAKALDAFYRDCVREVALLCGFDRVMLYRFLPDWTGEVIAEEASGKLKTRFLGLRFPASDIPSQARALYANSRIRVLADVLAVSDTLLPPLLPGDVPLDQSHSLLRGFSEVHQTYLKNMGVRATMSLSIVCDGKLWGLIACHHYQPRVPPHHVRETLRQVCELVQLLLRVYQAVLPEESIRAALSSLVPALLSTFEASAFCVRIGDFQYVGGATHSTASDAEITQELIAQFGANPPPAAVLLRTALLTSNATALATLPAAAGLLAVQQTGQTLDICAFTRPEVVREVDWAGAPVKRVATAADGRVRLEPRNSFALWKQEIGGTARPWSPAEAEACQRLLRILGDACRRRKHKALEQELRWHAHHDHLTGLVNRRSMEESLDQRLGAHCYDSAVMLIDLDHFKMINDTHGHAAGDHLLQALATRLGAVVRPTDILSRVGGDEFLLLAEMPLPDHGINATDLMRRADLALYRAKKSGRASTVIFDAKLEEGLLGTYELERDLQEAVGRNELSLVFQPQVNLSSGRVVGLEALVRWTHPARGSIGAGVFIPIAERSDLILQIGQWVVRTAIATMADWRLRGRTSPPISVNVSMTEVMSGTLVDTIGRQLREFQLPAECLTVELTESVIMKDPRVAMSVLSALKVLGVSTALDDFGTGYSSLSYLRQLPLACLKVDQSFIADLTRDAHSRSLTQAIIRMAEALKMTTIAEGVETRGQLQWLRSHKCDIGQGYLFSPAVPAELVHATNERIEAAWMGLHHGEVLRLT